MNNKILFVCTGNTCRSPMAEALARDIINKQNLNYEVGSRGLSVFVKSGPSNNSVLVMEKMNILISDHISQQLTEEDLKNYSYILTMTTDHKEKILQNYKNLGKIETISSFADSIGEDITDPFGGSLDDYEICANELRDYIEKIFIKLEKG